MSSENPPQNQTVLEEPPLPDALQEQLDRLQAGIKTDGAVDAFHAQERKARVAGLRRSAGIPKRAGRFCADREQAGGDEWWRDGSPWGDCVARTLEAVNGGGLVAVLGPQGHGKTTAAAAVARAVTASEQPVRWASVVDFVIAMQDAKINGHQQAEMREWSAPWLLVLDQADKMPSVEWEVRLLFTLLDRRYEAGKATLLLCNVADNDPNAWAAEIAAKLGGSVMDRIRETGVVEITSWPALRPDLGERV